MSETLAGTVSGLRRAAQTLADCGDRLLAVDPGAASFGAGGPGQLGELGREMYRQWQRAVDARGREAAAHGARLHEVAAAVTNAAGAYSEVDDATRRHQPEVR